MKLFSQLNTLRDIKDTLQPVVLPVLCEEYSRSVATDGAPLIHILAQSPNKNLRYNLFVWLMADTLLSNITFSTLPVHHYRKQLGALHRLYDIPLDNARRMYQSALSYFCFTCASLTSNAYHAQLSGSCAHSCALGHCRITYDPLREYALCTGSMRRRIHPIPSKPSLKCGWLPCIQLPLLGQCVTFFDTTYTLCYRCGCPTKCTARFGEHACSYACLFYPSDAADQ